VDIYEIESLLAEVESDTFPLFNNEEKSTISYRKKLRAL